MIAACCSSSSPSPPHRRPASCLAQQVILHPFMMTNTNKKPPHALLIPLPAQGHITPLMELGRRLAAMGVTVTLVTFQKFVDKIQSARAAAVAAAAGQDYIDGDENGEQREGDAMTGSEMGASHVRLVSISDGLTPGREQGTGMSKEVAMSIRRRMEDEVAQLIQQPLFADIEPVTCLIGDFFLSWMPHLAQRLTLPEVVFCPVNASVYSMFILVDLIVSRHGYNPYENENLAINSYGPRDEAAELITCLPGLPPMHPANLPCQNTAGKAGLEWLKGVMDERLATIDGAAALLVNSFEELEPHHRQVSQVSPPAKRLSLVGPLIPSPNPSINKNQARQYSRPDNSSLMEEDHHCIEWLDSHPPSSVVYVSFGSSTKFSAEQLHALALGLAASQQRFLWVIRKDSLLHEKTDTPIDAVLPRGFLEEIQGRGKVIQWAPQSLVLAHPAVGGFFSHCGWNSVLEGLSNGVPILGWPYFYDQFSNCWLVSEVWKIGLKLLVDEKNRAEKEEVKRAVQRLMTGEDAEQRRNRAKGLRDSGWKALAEDDGSSQKNLQHFVEECLMR